MWVSLNFQGFAERIIIEDIPKLMSSMKKIDIVGKLSHRKVTIHVAASLDRVHELHVLLIIILCAQPMLSPVNLTCAFSIWKKHWNYTFNDRNGDKCCIYFRKSSLNSSGTRRKNIYKLTLSAAFSQKYIRVVAICICGGRRLVTEITFARPVSRFEHCNFSYLCQVISWYLNERI